MAKAKFKPTEAELDILTILWEQGPCSVRYVNDKLNMTRRVGYTTTLKQLQIMHEKGLVSRNSYGRTHIYSAELGKEETQRQLLDRLLDSPDYAAFFFAWISFCWIRLSAIWIAFSAAPLRRLSDTHHSARPFSTVGSSRTRLTKVA